MIKAIITKVTERSGLIFEGPCILFFPKRAPAAQPHRILALPSMPQLLIASTSHSILLGRQMLMPKALKICSQPLKQNYNLGKGDCYSPHLSGAHGWKHTTTPKLLLHFFMSI